MILAKIGVGMIELYRKFIIFATLNVNGLT